MVRNPMLIGLALAALLATCAQAAVSPVKEPRGHDTKAKLTAAALAHPAPAASSGNEFPSEKVARMAEPSVVSIDVNNIAYGGVELSRMGMEMSRTGTLATKHLTGFVFDTKGDIVTDSNDIEGASLINVHTNDGKDVPAKVVGTDAFYGIGVIRVDVPKGYHVIPANRLKEMYDPFKDEYPYDQGDSVVAIGNSGGFGGTVTYGIISAIRNFRNRNQILLPSVIQSDVVINSGNEGCPLFNDKGEVIAMHERRGGGGRMQNTTFFTPINIIERAASEIIKEYESGQEIQVWHPWLGIKPFSGSRSVFGSIRQVTDDLKMYYDFPEQYWDVGVWLDDIYPESPAKEFGLQSKDILMTVQVLDAHEKVKHPYMLLKNIQDLELMVTTAAKGDVFVFGVFRSHTLKDVEVVVGQHPGEFDRNGQRTDMQAGIVDSSEYF